MEGILFSPGGTMLEAPVEDELGGQHWNAGRTDSQVSIVMLYIILPVDSVFRAEREGARS